MPETINGQTLYRTQEACKLAGISRATLFRWLRSGVVADVKHKDRRGWRRFTEEDIERLRDQATALSEGVVDKLTSRYRACYRRNPDNPAGYLEDCAVEYLHYVKESLHASKYLPSLISNGDDKDIQQPVRDFFLNRVGDVKKSFDRAKERGHMSPNADTEMLAFIYVFQYVTFLLAKQAGCGFIVDEDRIRRLIRGMFPSV